MGGENGRCKRTRECHAGSSPRGRGKRLVGTLFQEGVGLIPAWAGKTGRACGRASRPWAHPRVGGENPLGLITTDGITGSSPRGRGKRAYWGHRRPLAGLIPAWAGKTSALNMRGYLRSAHPRVGGENIQGFINGISSMGSSPRGRGKLALRGLVAGSRRLIPAWAGKTNARERQDQGRQAHPRVGGENLSEYW